MSTNSAVSAGKRWTQQQQGQYDWKANEIRRTEDQQHTGGGGRIQVQRQAETKQQHQRDGYSRTSKVQQMSQQLG